MKEKVTLVIEVTPEQHHQLLGMKTTKQTWFDFLIKDKLEAK